MRDMRARSWNASTLRGGEAHYYRNGKFYFEEELARPDVSSWAVLIAILFSGQTGNYIASRDTHPRKPALGVRRHKTRKG